MSYGSSGFLDIIPRITVDAERPTIIEKLHPEWQLIALRWLRRLQQSDLKKSVAPQRRDFVAVDRLGRSQQPHVGLHDAAFKFLVCLAVLHNAISKSPLLGALSAGAADICWRAPLSCWAIWWKALRVFLMGDANRLILSAKTGPPNAG
jgi:hypothetical protein